MRAGPRREWAFASLSDLVAARRAARCSRAQRGGLLREAQILSAPVAPTVAQPRVRRTVSGGRSLTWRTPATTTVSPSRRVVPGGAPALRERDAGDTGPLDSDHGAGKKLRKRRRKALRRAARSAAAIVLCGGPLVGADGAAGDGHRGQGQHRRPRDPRDQPAGGRVTSFEVPTPVELAHDFLWRVHRRRQAAGEIAVFDARATGTCWWCGSRGWCRKRCGGGATRSSASSGLLAEAGTGIFKFFLYIDADEQKERLQARLDDPDKRWKFDPADLRDRARGTQASPPTRRLSARTTTTRRSGRWCPPNR